MPRISYTAPTGATAEKMIERRGGFLTPLDQLLAHNDGLASGWNTLLGAVRQGFSIPGDLRELIILRVAVLNRADYEWAAHVGLGRASGIPETTIEAIAHDRAVTTGDERYDAVLAYTDAMTRNITVDEETFEHLRRHFTETETIELTATVASYNMVSRFLVALGVTAADRESLLTPNV
ncbi:alkylhydroperoxidase family enzyme [Sinomonas atrocyanea]|uniref:carboxymuconolactone decarboxylase family protein n=1 Tax=Sinomonas atrocyanea TaxID=37927 RepID=UPI00278B8185|nr:carboxymuconolactone decarboxylase family protein [Sinomonas atrocyanea]MDP9882841.1 alkylhydroperoxidase family enzyme [Sinomonas atrocyanea]